MARKKQTQGPDEGKADVQEQPQSAPLSPVEDALLPQAQEAATDGEAGTVTSGGSTFPVVGIGASAGGLEAFEQFFAHLPATTESGMAIVLAIPSSRALR